MDKSSHRGWQMHSSDMISWIMIQMYAEMEYMRCWLELVKFTIKMTNNVSSLASAVTSTIHYYKILAPNGQIFSSYIATDSGIFDDIPAMLWVQQPSYLISNHGIVWIFCSKWNLNGSCYWPRLGASSSGRSLQWQGWSNEKTLLCKWNFYWAISN